MVSMVKKLLAALAALAAIAALSSFGAATQITRVAVCDIAKVYEASRDASSPLMAKYEERRASIQAEIDARSAVIAELRLKKLDAEKAGQKELAQSLDAEMKAKTAELIEYHKARTAELESLKTLVADSSALVGIVYAEIGKLAELNGISVVLERKNDGILWSSPTIDLTDDLIAALKKRLATP